MAPTLAAAPPGGLGVAVSGGGDSVALLHLLYRAGGRTLAVVTVDHGLRREAAAEARRVAQAAAALGLRHQTLRWEAGGGPGNLQHRARGARRRLIADWARAEGLGAVALGHTRDDQAETVLMRLARGSGVDGLAGMAAVSGGDPLWLRPLLDVPRATLRDWLRGAGIGWDEDPSNDDPRFLRTRVRQALPALAAIGLDAGRLAGTARAMARARAALEADCAALGHAAGRVTPAGGIRLERDALAAAPVEIALRLLAEALCWVTGTVYRPRLATLEEALGALLAGQGRALHGALIEIRGGAALIHREPAQLAPPVPAGAPWDGRWTVAGAPKGAMLGALGAEGAGWRPDRSAGLTRAAIRGLPAVRLDGRLVAAPLLCPAPGLAFRRIAARPAPVADAGFR